MCKGGEGSGFRVQFFYLLSSIFIFYLPSSRRSVRDSRWKIEDEDRR
jgi:hypothetical protein